VSQLTLCFLSLDVDQSYEQRQSLAFVSDPFSLFFGQSYKLESVHRPRFMFYDRRQLVPQQRAQLNSFTDLQDFRCCRGHAAFADLEAHGIADVFVAAPNLDLGTVPVARVASFFCRVLRWFCGVPLRQVLLRIWQEDFHVHFEPIFRPISRSPIGQASYFFHLFPCNYASDPVFLLLQTLGLKCPSNEPKVP
jgi:hypothetical protein